MGTKMVAIIHPSGDCTLQGLDTSLESLQEVVGGRIETVSSGDGQWHGYVDEDGKAKGLPINTAATEVATRLGWKGVLSGDYIAGPMVLLGDAPGGREGDLPEFAVAVIQSYYDEPV